MAEKIGVYFDESSAGAYLDLEALAEGVRTKWADLCPVVRVHANLASEEGRATIQGDIDQGTIDGVCICGATPRVDAEWFSFDTVLVDRVNLREQCALSYKNGDGTVPEPGEVPPDLTKLAKDYVNMGIVRLQKTHMVQGDPVESEKTVLVLGGGWTGLTAAINAANAGYQVVLVEKECTLGGYAAKMYKTVPLTAPYTQAQDTGIDKKIAQVTDNDKIKVIAAAKLISLSGAPGAYEATIKGASSEEKITVGSVVVATGWAPQDTTYLSPFGYGSMKNVVTSMEFEEMAKKGSMVRPSDGTTPQSVMFLLSVGGMFDQVAAEESAAAAAEAVEEKKGGKESGEEEAKKDNFTLTKTYKHYLFSSEISSLNALKQAGYVREFNRTGTAFIVYEHMMVPGITELYYKSAQDDTGVMMTRGTITAVQEDVDGGLLVQLRNTLLGEDIEIKTDMLVLPTAMVPTTALEPIPELEYRQGSTFPDLELFDGFADSNYICFPYETRRTGIYTAGSVRQPMGLRLAESDAVGAALKAIQCIESANRGVAVHPRSGDMSYPKFNFIRCTQCKRCTEECPFGVLDEDEKGTPKPNTSRCRRCGTCMGACPERVISFDNYNIDQIGSMIRQIEVPDNMAEGGPRALIFACENDAYPALDMAAKRGHRWSPYVRIIPVRCLGSINTIWIADAIGKGVDGVMLMGCKYGDDYQCHFVKGSELCNRRMQNVAETLDRLGVEKERVVQNQVAIDEYATVDQIIDDFVSYITQLGPNPYKGY